MKHKCSVCGREIEITEYENEEFEFQCSENCARLAYNENPDYCVDCNCKLNYCEAFAGGDKCNFCKKADKFLGIG